MFPAREGDVFGAVGRWSAGAARSGPVGSGSSRLQSAFCHGGVGWPLEGGGMVAGSGKGQGSGGVGMVVLGGVRWMELEGRVGMWERMYVPRVGV